jgi:hypothetical protein
MMTGPVAGAVPVRLLHDIAETRALLGGVSTTTLYKFFQRRRLTRLKLGGRTMIARREIEQLVASMRAPVAR